MKSILLTVFQLFILLKFSYGQSLNGRVLSENRGLAGVQILVKENGTGCISDSSGYFRLQFPKSGSYKILFSLLGYAKIERNITISQNHSDTLIISMQEMTSQLNEVVVSGTLKEISKSNSPIPIEVYSPSYFEKNPTPALFEALQIVNGVRPQINCSVCNTGDIHINGMEGPYTLILIDGMPIVSGLGSVYGLNGIPNSMVERIEIVKGPASTLYGSEAVGGLINVITKAPNAIPQFSFDFFASSWQEYNLDLAVKTKLKQATSLLGVNYFRYQNRIDNNGDNFTDLTNQDRISIFNKWDFQRKNNYEASFAARYVYEDRFGGEMNWRPEFRGGDSIYGESIYTSRFELIGNYGFQLFKEKFIFQLSYSDHHQNSVYGNTLYIADQKTGFSQIRLAKTYNKHEFLGGLALRYNYYDDNTAATVSNDSTFSNLAAISWLPGLFIQDQIQLSEKSKLLSGIRYDYHFTHGSIISPRLNFQFQPNVKHNLRVGIGNGFRVVNLFTEEHAAVTGSRDVIVTENLRPEKSWNGTINYVRNFFANSFFASVDASLFYTYFSNKIMPDYSSDPDAIIYHNLNGYAISRGMNLNTDFNFNNRLKCLIGATLMEVYRIENGMKLRQLLTERVSGTFTVSYNIKKPNMTIDYSGNVYGPMDLPLLENDFRAPQSPWYSIQNIQLRLPFSKGKWECFGGVKNLLNFTPAANSIMRAFDPFDKQANDLVANPNNYTFDTAYVYSSFQGRRYFFGIRFTPEK